MPHSFKRCLKGKHDLIEISSSFSEMGIADEVVRWCKTCGSVVIDAEIDGEIKPGGYAKMRIPTEVKRRLKS